MKQRGPDCGVFNWEANWPEKQLSILHIDHLYFHIFLNSDGLFRSKMRSTKIALPSVNLNRFNLKSKFFYLLDSWIGKYFFCHVSRWHVLTFHRINVYLCREKLRSQNEVEQKEEGERKKTWNSTQEKTCLCEILLFFSIYLGSRFNELAAAYIQLFHSNISPPPPPPPPASAPCSYFTPLHAI